MLEIMFMVKKILISFTLVVIDGATPPGSNPAIHCQEGEHYAHGAHC